MHLTHRKFLRKFSQANQTKKTHKTTGPMQDNNANPNKEPIGAYQLIELKGGQEDNQTKELQEKKSLLEYL